MDASGSKYVLAASPSTAVFAPGTVLEVPKRQGKTGRPRSRARPGRGPESIGELVAGTHADAFETVTCRDGETMTSRFAFLRVRAAHEWQKTTPFPPDEDWLIAEWPKGREEPTGYWLPNLPEDAAPERLARLARLRWKIELDYKQLKGELGLDHYEGRSWLGRHHHTTLVTAAHGFLTLKRLCPKARRPA